MRGAAHAVCAAGLRALPLALPLALLLAGCGSAQNTLRPRGPGAEALALHWWIFLAVLTAVAVIVLALLGVALRRGARGGRARFPGGDNVFILVAGGLIPFLILVGLLLEVFRTGAALRQREPAALVVDAVGHQFWWEFRYPQHGVVTANEVHVPAGRPVEFHLTSADVIHSFWFPELQGKLDMNPGGVNRLWLQADEPGVYRGQCAEFCGVQHAFMAMLLIAQTEEEFAAWLERVRRPATAPGDADGRRGLEVFLRAECAQCHAIRGVVPAAATVDVGPDLTHLGLRRTLAAATLANNRGNLAGWVLDPQAHKPGARMPRTLLEPEELRALVSYLEGLR
jgi:cytochrome c oxidase subunit II